MRIHYQNIMNLNGVQRGSTSTRTRKEGLETSEPFLRQLPLAEDTSLLISHVRRSWRAAQNKQEELAAIMELKVLIHKTVRLRKFRSVDYRTYWLNDWLSRYNDLVSRWFSVIEKK